MRDNRRSLGAAFLIAALVSAPSAGIATAVRSLPNLVSGIVRNAAGGGTAGRVLLFHDDLRDRNCLELLGTARSGADGRYNLSLLPNAETMAAASRNSGFVNFALVAITGRGVSRLQFFSARQDGRGAWVGGNNSLPAIEICATSSPPEPEYATRVEAALSTLSHPADGDPLETCLYDRVQAFDAQTPVIELHTWYRDLTGTATYARTRTSDSDITVGRQIRRLVDGWHHPHWQLHGNIGDGNQDRAIRHGAADLVPVPAVAVPAGQQLHLRLAAAAPGGRGGRALERHQPHGRLE